MAKPVAESLSREMRLPERGNKQRINRLGITKNIIVTIFLLSGVFLGILSATTPGEKKPVQSKDTVHTFHKDVLPLLQANCNPCHFSGGKMYNKLPFDDSATVAVLGMKLIKRFNTKEEQNIIDGWVGQSLKGTDSMSK